MLRHTIPLGLAVVLLSNPSAWGYTIASTQGGTPIHWAASPLPIRYYIDSAASRDVPDGSDIAAVQSAFQTWEHVASGRIAFQFAGLVERGEIEPTANMVMWLEEEWPYDSSYVSKTRLYYEKVTGRILKAEILLNGRDYRWSTDGEAGTLDVQNVATHEIGHFIGLEDEYTPGRTMFEFILIGEREKRYLSDDDIDGLVAVYPRGGDGSLGQLIIRQVEFDGLTARHAADYGVPLEADRFVALCALEPLDRFGIIAAQGGDFAISVLGSGGAVEAVHVVPSGGAVHPGRVRAVSSLDLDGNGVRSEVAALVSAPEGLRLYACAVPSDAGSGRILIPGSFSIKGAEDIIAFASIPAGEEGFAGALVAAEKRRNSEHYLSILLPVAEGDVITLEPLRSWLIPGCAAVLGLAAIERMGNGPGIVALIRTPEGALELAAYAAPFGRMPADGSAAYPSYRVDASELFSGGTPLSVTALPSGIAVIFTR